MSIKRQKMYQLTLGILGLVLLLALTLFKKDYMNWNILLFFIFLCSSVILQKIELRIGEFTLTFDTAVMIASYFTLGLVPTLWLMGIVYFFYRIIISKPSVKSVFSNTGMMMLIYILTHYSFKLLGYDFDGELKIANGIVVAIFSINVFLLNWLFLLLYFRICNIKIPTSWFEGLKWDFYGNVLIIPLSILLVEAYYTYSYIGLIVLSLLIMFANLLFKLMRNLVFLNNELRVVHKVSVSISSKLELKETTSNTIDGINELVKCDYCSILMFDLKKDSVKTMASKAFKDKNIDINDRRVEKYISEKLNILKNQKMSFIENKTKIGKMILDIEKISNEIKSVIYEPLIANNEIIGCILVYSKQYKKFLKEHLSVMDILANQAAIAIENARMYKEIKNRAIKDALTGLFNQSYFFDALDSITGDCSICTRQKCINCSTTSLIIFDIDHFKKVNDTYGHQTGDKILKDVTKIIKENVRKSDIVSRYGGEEFTVILPKTDETTAYKIADRIREIIEEDTFRTANDKKINITISGGVSEFPRQADSGSTLLAYADRAMYIGSKRQGRNKISKYIS